MSKLIKTGVFDAENSNILTENFDSLFTEAEEYVLPTADNLDAGPYQSKLERIEIVYDNNHTVSALDCYHCLEDADGNITHVRFRYYFKGNGVEKLKKALKGYGLNNFEAAINIEEDVVVSQRESSEYLYISSRKKVHKKAGGILSSKRRQLTVAPPDDDPDFDDFLPDEDDD